MSDTQEPRAEPLSLDETARAAAELAMRGDASRVAAGFLELVQRWAAPSAVLAALRDPQASAGWRLLPSLCAGSLTLGIERTLARLAEDTPECLARPTVLRGDEVPGIRVRDNLVVPWWCERDSGLLVLRGVPRPFRAGLGEALALAGAVVWPRLLGSPATQLEALVRELRAGAARLEAEAGRQLERLQAATPPPAAAADATPDARTSELEAELAALRKERESLARELEAAQRAQAAGERGGGDDAQAPHEGTAAATTQAPAAASDRTSMALERAVAAVRRAAFVPPLLRVSIEDVAALTSPVPRPARRLGIALLDRDVVPLEPVADELEAAGIEVRLAHQPEELALLLRTADASAIQAVVCDVMSFRPDQNVAGLLRGWDKDRPGLAFYLSYDAQSAVELERARRTPMSLTAGHIQRPLTAARLGETLDNLAKRLGKT